MERHCKWQCGIIKIMKEYFKIASILTFAGVLFAGYLSAIKLFSGTCAFNESCPYFLGYPACWYGFIFFVVMFGAALYGKSHVSEGRKMANTIATISLIGILFAGQFVVREILDWIATGKTTYALFLPTCAYGLIFYILIFIFSGIALTKKRGSRS
jgi:hypothetical protein